jgi:hypothetical protein
MAGNDDRVVRRRRKAGIGRRDHAIDAAAGRIIDERIDAVPKGITDVNDVGFGKCDGDVSVGMCWPVIRLRRSKDRNSVAKAIPLSKISWCPRFARVGCARRRPFSGDLAALNESNKS